VRGVAATLLAVVALLAFSIVAAAMAAAVVADGDSGPPPGQLSPVDCVSGYGGGVIGFEGEMPHDSAGGPAGACGEQLAGYARQPGGAYWAQLEAVAASAERLVAANAGPWASGGAARVFVFDIDETAVSNLATMRAHGPRARLVAPAAWAAALRAADAPPILPVRRLYATLHASNISAAFVTGRGEAERGATEALLERAGYGRLCGPAGGGAASPQPCYVALHLRAPGDARLASVYKPERRQALVDAGYQLVGSIGDQFSDSSGAASAPLSFKLPNPWYYLL
jgi:hypothetical protein